MAGLLKTRSQMMDELSSLRERVAALEAALGERLPLATCAVFPVDSAEMSAVEPRRANGTSTPKVGPSPVDSNVNPGSAWPREWELWRSVLTGVSKVLCGIDCDGTVRVCEGEGVTAFGVSREAVIGRRFDALFGIASAAGCMVRRALLGERVQGKLPIDHSTTFQWWWGPSYGETGKIVGAIGLGIDLAELDPAARRFAADQQSTEELLRWHEQDRRLIAYEIHDGFVQEATGAMMHLEMLLQTGRIAEGEARQEVELSLRLVRKAVAEARRLISGLRPPILEELGLVAAIEYLIDDQPPGGPSIKLCVDVQFDRLEAFLEGTIYRIVQEAITNVRRHSRSDRAEVRLFQSRDHLQVEVRDWGVGFDPNGIQGKRFGLRGICERARLLRGRTEIDSVPGQGTRVFVDLPLARAPREVATT